jgi:GT2 family glycosyltransferase
MYVAKLSHVVDVAVVIVSHRERAWLRPCLDSVLSSTGGCELEVVVVCNGQDGSADFVEKVFPDVRVVRCENRGFAHASNIGLQKCESRYAILLNADTEVRSGTFAALVEALDQRPEVGAAGVVQVSPTGDVHPTIRRFPNALRAFGEALGYERWPVRPSAFGERELDMRRYDQEQPCDWMSGSFLALRREALHEVGALDEGFFLYSEEPDLCLRIKRAGWDVRHLPEMVVIHHAGRGSENPRLAAQGAYARSLFAHKHFARPHRWAYSAALGLGYALRAVLPLGQSRSEPGRRAARSALSVLMRLQPPPFG